MPLKIVRNDITKMKVDAIVNTTNREMVGYSGVDLAIHEAAGPLLDEACARLAPLGLGTAKITPAFEFDAKYVIHTSGPKWRGGYVGESIILRSCYIECLKLALRNKCESIAFPLISSGTYGYPKDRVLRFAIEVITEFLFEHEMTVYICVFDRSSYEFSKKLFCEISEFIDDGYVEKKKIAQFKAERELEEAFLSSQIDSDLSPNTRAGDFFDSESLEEYLRSMDKPFAEKLFSWIDKRGMTDVECYKRANVDKKTFSKIKCNPKTYKPSKQTAVAFAIALRLDLEQTQDLLASAGLTLSKSFTFDKIIRYFIQKKNYNVFEINEALFEFDQSLLGV